jgi:hypothetical protein
LLEAGGQRGACGRSRCIGDKQFEHPAG